MLSGYHVLELVGRGGMGAVYKARQVSLDRLVAIKVLPPNLWDDEENYAQRFRHEARMMARVMHPGMIAVFDFGEIQGSYLYIVMEYVEGTDVARMIQQQKRLDPLHAISIAAHVCDTLGYAHEQGIIHRDIKPANVMVDMEGRVKVADFGLAKHTTLDPDESHSTKTMGTPDYVAPEALTMGMKLDGRADLYSLGVMIYEMLTGQVPRGFYSPPSEVVPGLDTRLDAIVTRALQRDRAARYQKAGEIRAALNHILTVPAAKTPPPRPPRPGPGMGAHRPQAASRRASNSRSPWGMVTLLGLVFMAAGGGYYYFTQHELPGVQEREEKEITTASAPGAAVPAETPPMPAGPDVGKGSAGTGADMAGTASHLETLAAQYRAALDREVVQVEAAALRDLDGKYEAALDRSMITVSGEGNNLAVAALQQEKVRLASRQPLPATDGPEAPPALVELRRIYRTTREGIEGRSLTTRQGLQGRYEQVLAEYETQLLGEGKTAAAGRVTQRLAEVRESAPKPPEPSPAPSPAPVSGSVMAGGQPASAVPVTPVTGAEARLQEFLTGTSWRWRGLNNESLDFLPEGKLDCESWKASGLGVTWTVTGPRNVRLKIVSGRSEDTEANLVFSDDLTTYSGTDFGGQPFRFDGSRIEVIHVPASFTGANEPFAGRIHFAAGEYRMKERLILGGPDPVSPDVKSVGRAFSAPGARLVGGAVFIDKGSWQAEGTLFAGIEIKAEFGATFEAKDSLFSAARLGKGGGWFGDAFSSKWTFRNCAFAGSFISPWKVIDIGVQVEGCTFHEVDFPALVYAKDAGKEVARDWFQIRNSRFINCKIPESLLIATKDCVFENCTFGSPEEDLRIETPVKTTVYLTDTRQAPVTGPMRQIEVLPAARVPVPAGATLRYFRNGTMLNFQ
jgi:hypothetical protein